MTDYIWLQSTSINCPAFDSISIQTHLVRISSRMIPRQSWHTIHVIFCIFLVSLSFDTIDSSCAQLGNCNGHGRCQRNSTCSCFEGWGSSTDFSTVKSADCSTRICPADLAWAGLADYSGEVHIKAECSNAGVCNRETGMCECFPGYTGHACQRKGCINDCSGHGRCVSKQLAARMSGALPVNRDTKYGEKRANASVAWDAQAEYLCICDSSWVVGSDREQRSDSEWFGPDCSLRHCPSANNPVTLTTDETSCWNQTLPLNALYPGREGSICQVDCAGQGICDYTTGTCACFQGFIGADCGRRVDYEEVIVPETIVDTDDYYYSPPPNDDDFPLKNVLMT